MTEKIRVVFLPRWYPHRYDPMPGLFIQRQAEAITPYCDVAVIYLHPDPHCPNNFEVEFSQENQVRVLRVYYKINPDRHDFFSKLHNLWRFYRAGTKALHSIRGLSPDIIYVHVLTRMGIMGWLAHRKFGAPMVISEHWSRYLPENSTSPKGFHRLITKWLIGKAAALIPVSETLRRSMHQLGFSHLRTFVIPNVIDAEGMAYPLRKEQPEKKNILHLSCFEDRSKNITLLLESIAELSLSRSDFMCFLAGEGPDLEKMKTLARDLGIYGSFVTFTGLIQEQVLQDFFASSDFLVLSSRYETFGSVVVEALSAGLPVVSTAVGIVPEIINASNGIIVGEQNMKALTAALNLMLDHCRTYDPETLHKSIEGRFTKKQVGMQIVQFYRDILKNN